MFINNIWYTLVLKINLLLQILPYLLTIRTFKLILKVALSSLKVYSWNIPACINAFPCTHLASSTVNFNPLELTKQVAVCSNQIINWAVCKSSVFILLLLLLILRLIITKRRRRRRRRRRRINSYCKNNITVFLWCKIECTSNNKLHFLWFTEKKCLLIVPLWNFPKSELEQIFAGCDCNVSPGDAKGYRSNHI